MSNNFPKRMFRFFTKAVSILFNCLIVIVLLEVFFIAVYYLHDGMYVSAEDKLSEVKPRYIHKLSSCTSTRSLASHPYLGYSWLAKPYCKSFDKQAGHNGLKFPLEKNSDVFTVLVTGASVPRQLLEKVEPSLGEALSNRYHFQGKKIHVLSGTIDGWKQPQQLTMLLLYADVIDAVVTIEGYNEFTFGRHHSFEYQFNAPVFPIYKKANPGLMSHRQISLMWGVNTLFEKVEDNGILRRSKAVFFLLDIIRRYAKKELKVAEEMTGMENIDALFRFPEGWDQLKRMEHYMQSYLQHVRYMHAIAQDSDLKFSYFLQPIPIHGKPLSAEEKQRFSKGSRYRKNYLVMADHLMALQNEGIEMNSLLDVFADYPGTAYKDRIHLLETSEAPGIMIDRIVDELANEWQLEPIEPMGKE